MSEVYRRDAPANVFKKITRKNEIEERMAELQEEMKSLQAELADLQAQLLPFQSQSSIVDLTPKTPIMKCPNEILHSIFTHTIADYHPRIRSLLLVCRHWNTIIMTSPRFWTEIGFHNEIDPNFFDPEYSRNYINACLKRSENLLLDINLPIWYYDSHKGYIIEELDKFTRDLLDPEDQSSFSQQLWEMEFGFDSPKYVRRFEETFTRLLGKRGKNIKRWRSLSISFPEDLWSPIDLWNRFDAPAPNLRSLTLIGASTYNGGLPGEDDWLKYGLNQLSNVNEFDSNTDIPISHLGLSTLNLHRLTVAVEPHFRNFRELNSFINLHSLTLKCRGHSKDSPPPPTGLTLDLPKLTELILDQDYVILRHVNFIVPSLNTLTIQTASQFHPLPTLAPRHIRWDDKAWSRCSKESAVFNALATLFLSSTRTETLGVDKRYRSFTLRAAAYFSDQGLLPSMTKILIFDDKDDMESIDIGNVGLIMEEMGLERLSTAPSVCEESIFVSSIFSGSDISDEPEDL